MLFSNIGVLYISYLHSHSWDVNKDTLSVHLSSSDNSSVHRHYFTGLIHMQALEQLQVFSFTSSIYESTTHATSAI